MKRLTRQGAINAFCKQCIYDPHSGAGTWREQVWKCTSVACPLYDYRPHPRAPAEAHGGVKVGSP